MGYTRSIVIGSVLVIIVLLISIATFYYSRNSCSEGSFPCDDGTCIVQRKFCDFRIDCPNGSDEAVINCGIYHGSKEMISNALQTSNGSSEKIDKLRETCKLRAYAEDYDCEFLTKLSCNNKNITEIPKPIPKEVRSLRIANNRIVLKTDDFRELSALKKLRLINNSITQLPPDIFKGLHSVNVLDLGNNLLKTLPENIFQDLISLEQLFLDKNQLGNFSLAGLNYLNELVWLELSCNLITMENESFPKLDHILEISLHTNLIETINDGMFAELVHLQMLDLNNNKITTIHPDAFIKLIDLRELRIANNFLTMLPLNIFKNLPLLDALYIGNNTNLKMSMELIGNTNLTFLSLENVNEEYIAFDAIQSMKNLKYIIYKNFYYCSRTPHVMTCKPNTDAVSSLQDLLKNEVLRYSAWMMALVTCLGNTIVLWGRFTFRDENRAVSMVIRNLAVSDVLMGIYLCIIGITDQQYRDKYHLVAYEWVGSWCCIVAGVLAMVSSEVTMLILAFMSIERFLLIADPFGGRHKRLNTQNVFFSLFIIWLIGGTIAIIPIIHWRSNKYFYGTYSGTCFPMHLDEHYPLGWEYSTFVFLGINLSLLVLIAALYSALLFSIWKTRRATPLAMWDCEFAIRFFFIVLTEVACWIPIIGLKIAAFFSYELSGDLHAWLLVFALPLNSAINPLLYTFTTPKYRDRIWNNNQSWQMCNGSSGSAANQIVKPKNNNNINNDGVGVINSTNPSDESNGKILPLLYTPTGIYYNLDI